MSRIQEIDQLIQQGRGKKVCETIQAAMDEGISAADILREGMLPAMSAIGEKFKNNEVFVPEVLVAARAMNMGMALLKPYMADCGIEPAGTAVIGTVRGDMHDIGKNLVKMMIEGKGLRVVDLGVDVSPEKFLEAAEENHADIICCSALLTTTMGEIKNILAYLEARNVRGKYKVMIGGAPVSQSYCDAIGADYYTPDAASAADVAYQICRQA
jgi:methanogenic corrinoid protein MtbC1